MIVALLAGVTLLAQEPPTYSDSAGVVRVVHTRLGSQATAFRIAESPLLMIGGMGDDPVHELTARNPFPVARPLRTGGWAVLDWFALKLFDERGRYLRTIGRPGRGPGEFGQLRELCITPGDTLIALGYSDRRLVVFDQEGNHLRTTRVAGPVWSDPCFPDGTVLVRTATAPNPASTLPPTRAAILDLVFEGQRFDWRTERARAIGRFSATSRDLMIPDGGNAVVGAGRIHVGNGWRPEYRVYTLDGRLERIVRWQATPAPVTAALRQGQAMRSRLPPSPREVLPYYHAIRVDSRGRVWVEDYDRGGWSVFGPAGEYLGRITVPARSTGRTEVAWIGTDRILLAWRDADGSPCFSLHPLVPRS